MSKKILFWSAGALASIAAGCAISLPIANATNNLQTSEVKGNDTIPSDTTNTTPTNPVNPTVNPTTDGTNTTKADSETATPSTDTNKDSQSTKPDATETEVSEKNNAQFSTNLTYRLKIDSTIAVDTSSLNDYLKKNFNASLLTGNNQFVNFAYVDGKANFDKGVFQVDVTPQSGYTWQDDSTRIITATVKIEQMSLKDADITTNLNYSIGLNYEVGSNQKLDAYLQSNFSLNQLKGSFQNVDIVYKKGSANYNSKTFQVTVTPKVGHIWKDNIYRIMDITVNLQLSARAPKSWAINTIGRQSFYNSTNYFSLIDGLGNLGFNEMKNSFPNLVYKGVVKPNTVQIKTINANSSVLYFDILVADVSNQNKTMNVTMELFLNNSFGVNGWVTNSYMAGVASTTSDGLPTQWVADYIQASSALTGDLYDATAKISDQLLFDLNYYYGTNWKVSIDSMQIVGQSSNTVVQSYAQNWTYKVTFVSKTNANVTKTITGYAFTQTN
ncbi:MAG: hypothetical protein HUJ42_00050 [Malacoplasma sp.]|nr:hypothetical protein [Malacoplasma sp.]